MNDEEFLESLSDDDDLDDLTDPEFDVLMAVVFDKAAAEHAAVCDDDDCEGA